MTSAFSALTLLVGHLAGEVTRWCYCHPVSRTSVKSRLVLPFWYLLTRVVSEKDPLNARACVCVCAWDLHFTRYNGDLFSAVVDMFKVSYLKFLQYSVYRNHSSQSIFDWFVRKIKDGRFYWQLCINRAISLALLCHCFDRTYRQRLWK